MVRKSTKLRTSSREKYSLTWKLGLIAALVLFSLWKLFPSIQYYTLSTEQREAMDPGDLDRLRSKALNLGLDLQGGIHLVMQVDTSGMEGSEANDAVDQAWFGSERCRRSSHDRHRQPCGPVRTCRTRCPEAGFKSNHH